MHSEVQKSVHCALCKTASGYVVSTIELFGIPVSTEPAFEPVLPLPHAPGLCDRIAYAIAAEVIRAQQRAPEALQPRFRSVDLATKQSQLVAKFSSMLNLCQDFAALRKVTNGILQQLLLPPFFETPECRELLQHIKALTIHFQQPSRDGFRLSVSPSPSAVGETEASAALLLDAENINLSDSAEEWIAQFCKCTLKTKIAFANWRALGNRDQILHQREYQLIHVPPGKNRADLEMTALGAAMWLFAPRVQEVIICSSDRDLDHLRRTLTTQGLIVYQVRQRNNSLVLTNGKPQALAVLPLMVPVEIPSLSAGLEFLKTYLTGVSEAPVSLSTLGVAFRQHFKIPLHAFIVHHGFNQKPKAFLESQPNFVVVQIDHQAYVSIERESVPTENQKALKSVEDFTPRTLGIVSKGILKRLTQERRTDKIPLSLIAAQFRQQHGQPIKSILQKHSLGKSLPKFFLAIQGIQVEWDEEQKQWLVCLSA